MNCGQIANSVQSWQKISGISMKPRIALAILRYTKKIQDEFEFVEKQRVALIYKVTGSEPGSEVKVEPGTEEFKKYITGLQEIFVVESDLEPIDLDFEEVIDAVENEGETLSVSDLAKLEPFFADRPPNLPDDCLCECLPDNDCCK